MFSLDQLKQSHNQSFSRIVIIFNNWRKNNYLTTLSHLSPTFKNFISPLSPLQQTFKTIRKIRKQFQERPKFLMNVVLFTAGKSCRRKRQEGSFARTAYLQTLCWHHALRSNRRSIIWIFKIVKIIFIYKVRIKII